MLIHLDLITSPKFWATIWEFDCKVPEKWRLDSQICFLSFFDFFRIQVSRNAKFYANSKTVFKIKEKIAHKKNFIVKVQKSGFFLIYYCFQKKVFDN